MKTYIQKPYKYSIIEYTEQIRTLFKYKKYLQPPRMCGKWSLEADWENRKKVVPKKLIRKAIRDGLHDTMQDKLDLKDGNYHLFGNERFNEYLETVNHNKMSMRYTHKRSWYKIKYYSGSNDNSHSSSGRIPKKARKEVKKTSQGEVIFCSCCKRSGVTYSKYSSHSDNSCNDAEYMKKKINGRVSEHDSVTKSFEKQDLSCFSKLKRAHMKTKRIYKLASRAFNKSDLKIISEKMEDSSDSISNYYSESETSSKQDIRRYETREKPSCKKRAVDNNFGVRNPRIKSNTGDWLWGYPFHFQEYKDKFGKFPYSSYIKNSRDKWTTGQHEINANPGFMTV